MTREGERFVLIDVRPRAAFEAGHLEGAVNIPAQDLSHRTFPAQRALVLVDDALGQKAATEAAAMLAGKGMERVFVLTGGFVEGKRQGLPQVETAVVVRGVTARELAWARENGITMRVFDLRDKAVRKHGPMPDSETIEGATMEERLARLASLLGSSGPSGPAARLKPATPVVLVFAASDDGEAHTRRLARDYRGDVRYVIGGYESTLTDSMQGRQVVGACTTCPGKGK